MIWPDAWTADSWFYPALAIGLLAAVLVVWGYSRVACPWWLKLVLGSLKLTGIGLLIICLLEPMRQQSIPSQDANVMVVLVDRSESLQTKDRGAAATRADQLQSLIATTAPWQASLDETFDVRRFVFGSRLEAVNDYSEFVAEQDQTNLSQALQLIANRFANQPCAGVLLLTDGNATDDLAQLDWSDLPPIYPVPIGDLAGRDISVERVSVSQTNFESAPVTVAAEVSTHGFAGKSVVVQLIDDQQQEVSRETISGVQDDKRFAVRFELKPESRGAHFYQVRAFADGTQPEDPQLRGVDEATTANNVYPLVVDRGQGPYRILYVTGRPNWELKYLRRGLLTDDEIELYSLIRIARREPKFSFRSREDGRANPLFRGTREGEDDQAEQYDRPVLLALPVDAPLSEPLRRGFPATAEGLFEYDAVVIDDLESDFFTADMQSLLERFVSDRGGSLLMLGGAESFIEGGYDRTPIGGLLPVHLRRVASVDLAAGYQLQLTRDGWLQEWVRMHPTQAAEQQRLAEMPPFQTLNQVGAIKPGASVLARVESSRGDSYPALAVQRFGRGRAAALMIGDFWRWHMRSQDHEDLLKAWRQLARWLVADVPRRVDIEIDHTDLSSLQVRIDVRDETYRPLDNCRVQFSVQPHQPDLAADLTADQAEPPAAIVIPCEPDDSEPGVYRGSYTPREPGAYRVQVNATAADGTEIGQRDSGWVFLGNAQEFRMLNANRQQLEQIAVQTGGRLVEAEQLDRFVQSIPVNPAMVVETQSEPWWHHWSLFACALGCLIAEWGLRRMRGLP